MLGHSAGQDGTNSTHARNGRCDVDPNVVKCDQAGRGGVSAARRVPWSNNPFTPYRILYKDGRINNTAAMKIIVASHNAPGGWSKLLKRVERTVLYPRQGGRLTMCLCRPNRSTERYCGKSAGRNSTNSRLLDNSLPEETGVVIMQSTTGHDSL